MAIALPISPPPTAQSTTDATITPAAIAQLPGEHEVPPPAERPPPRSHARRLVPDPLIVTHPTRSEIGVPVPTRAARRRRCRRARLPVSPDPCTDGRRTSRPSRVACVHVEPLCPPVGPPRMGPGHRAGRLPPAAAQATRPRPAPASGGWPTCRFMTRSSSPVRPDHTYYLYTSNQPSLTGSRRSGTMVYRSRDLLHWEEPTVVFTVPDGTWADPRGGPGPPRSTPIAAATTCSPR